MTSPIARCATGIRQWRGQLLDLLFPSRCASCHRIGESLCPRCLSSIRLVEPPFCPRCGQPPRFEGEPCFQCRVYPLHLAQIRAVAYHEGPLRKAVHAFKYARRIDLAGPLSALLQQHLLSSALRVDLITAVPLHPGRRLERGYNQSELLGRELARGTGIRYVDGVVRLRATSDQVGLSAAARRANVEGAFSADPRAFRGCRVLLVDDVCTTGATIDACAVALGNAGAQLIYGLAVARPR